MKKLTIAGLIAIISFSFLTGCAAKKPMAETSLTIAMQEQTAAFRDLATQIKATLPTKAPAKPSTLATNQTNNGTNLKGNDVATAKAALSQKKATIPSALEDRVTKLEKGIMAHTVRLAKHEARISANEADIDKLAWLIENKFEVSEVSKVKIGNFSFGSVVIEEHIAPQVIALAKAYAQVKNTKEEEKNSPQKIYITVMGFADPEGDETKNKKVSLNRARVVAALMDKELKNLQVKDFILGVVGMGETEMGITKRNARCVIIDYSLEPITPSPSPAEEASAPLTE